MYSCSIVGLLLWIFDFFTCFVLDPVNAILFLWIPKYPRKGRKFTWISDYGDSVNVSAKLQTMQLCPYDLCNRIARCCARPEKVAELGGGGGGGTPTHFFFPYNFLCHLHYWVGVPSRLPDRPPGWQAKKRKKKRHSQLTELAYCIIAFNYGERFFQVFKWSFSWGGGGGGFFEPDMAWYNVL